ncbi:MAG: hypothetical protein LBV41_02425 [Cytophagaceae bacterium]|jgi:REP element-mobilizing transposase RayT|nr:hypothetical protein [Cytophagaceae bacterium]
MNRYNPDLHHRRSVRLLNYDYAQEGLYFVTICVKSREYLFGKIADGEMWLNEIGKMVENEWLYLPAKYPNINLHQFVVMPNHFHGILQIVSPSNAVTVGAGSAHPMGFARPVEFTNPINNPLGTSKTDRAGESNRVGKPRPYAPTLGNMIAYFKYRTTKQIDLSAKLWQRNYYEHIVRNDADYTRIANYIANNSANWQTDCFYEEYD